MKARAITLRCKKNYELTALYDKILQEFENQNLNVEFVEKTYHEFGEAKTLLLVFERLYLRTASYTSLTILLTEFKGIQTADIISSGGKEIMFSFGSERNFAKHGETALKNLGFENFHP